VGGAVRIHTGSDDQQPDPLIATAEGADQCPAFRGMAYVVFESLQLADFGNRIPTLSFEILADETMPALNALMADVVDDVTILGQLSGIEGFSCEGTIADTLAQFQPLFPMMCDANGDGLSLRLGVADGTAVELPEPAITTKDGEFQAASGFQRSRVPPSENPITALRYYDPALDYQPGTQQVIGQSRFGRAKTIEVPAVMAADAAARLVNQAARASGWSRDTMVALRPTGSAPGAGGSCHGLWPTGRVAHQ
jgi:hypothetical protein